MRAIPDFRLKRFFNEGPATAARANLSPSFAEPLPLAQLLAFESEATERLTRLSLAYTEIHGGREVRAAIAAQYDHLAPDHVVVTCGADDALSSLFLALVEPGDHVIVHAPLYQPLASLAAWRGGQVTLWPAHEEQGWRPDLEELAQRLRPATRLIVANFPHSPTGFVPDCRYLERLAALADDAGATLLCDEIYRGLPLTDAGEPPSLADLSLGAVVLSSTSKAYGLPGLRVGWLATRNATVLGAVRRLRLHLNTFVGAPSEFLAALALRHAGPILARNRALARANLAHLRDFLGRHDRLFAWQAPQGGVIAFPRWLGAEPTSALSDRLLREHGLLLAPSAHFAGGERHVRLGFGTAATPANLLRRRRRTAVDHHRGRPLEHLPAAARGVLARGGPAGGASRQAGPHEGGPSWTRGAGGSTSVSGRASCRATRRSPSRRAAAAGRCRTSSTTAPRACPGAITAPGRPTAR